MLVQSVAEAVRAFVATREADVFLATAVAQLAVSVDIAARDLLRGIAAAHKQRADEPPPPRRTATSRPVSATARTRPVSATARTCPAAREPSRGTGLPARSAADGSITPLLPELLATGAAIAAAIQAMSRFDISVGRRNAHGGVDWTAAFAESDAGAVKACVLGQVHFGRAGA